MLQCALFTVCTIHSVHYSQCALFTVCTVHSVHYSQCTLFTMCTVHSVHYSQCTLFTVCTIHSVHCSHCVNKTHKYIPSQKKINNICAMQNFQNAFCSLMRACETSFSLA